MEGVEYPRENCPFCQIAQRKAVATVLRSDSYVYIMVPSKPVVHGHVVAFTKTHVFDKEPHLVASLTYSLMHYAREMYVQYSCFNTILNHGPYATWNPEHLHMHLIPRTHNDNLLLPWTNKGWEL